MTEPSKTEETSPNAAADSAQTLVRSKTEIARFLANCAARKTQITATFSPAQYVFATCVRQVDPAQEYILVDYTGNETANKALLTVKSVAFAVMHGEHKIEFLAVHPTDISSNGSTCIRFDFPQTLLVQRRREHPRIPVEAIAPLHCIADTQGLLSFECTIVDVSRGGLGTMIFDNSVILEPGTVLQGCQVEHAGSTLEFDMEVRYAVDVKLPDGSPARRAGCRLLGPNIAELTKLFLPKNIDPPAAGNP